MERSPSPTRRESSPELAYRDRNRVSTPPNRVPEGSRRVEGGSPDVTKNGRDSLSGRGRAIDDRVECERARSASAEYRPSVREESHERKGDVIEDRDESHKGRSVERLPERDATFERSRHDKEDEAMKPSPRAKTPDQSESNNGADDTLDRVKTTPQKGREEKKDEIDNLSDNSRVLPPIRTMSSSPSPPPRDGLAALASYGDDPNRDRSDSPPSGSERPVGPHSEKGDARSEKGEKDEEGSLKRRFGSDDEGDRPERKRSRPRNEEDGDRSD